LRSNPQDVLEVPDREVYIRPSGTKWRYGTIGLGIDHQAPTVWREADHVFASHDTSLDSHKQDEGGTVQIGTPHRVPARILNKHQVDCLLVEGWEPTVWKPWVERAGKANRPKIILSWTTVGELENEEGVFKKSTRKAIENLGYHTTYWLLEAWKYGAALDQTRLAVVHFRFEINGGMPTLRTPRMSGAGNLRI
jgi:hypothetical protein